MPVAVPMMPSARLKCPLPKATSATISGIITAKTAAVMPSNTCTATIRNGSVTVANKTPRIASAPKPISGNGRLPCLRLASTAGDISATMACGTMMQAAIRTGAHWLDRVVTTPAMIGSMAALANCSSRMLAAKDQQGLLTDQVKTWSPLVGRLARDGAMRLHDVDLPLADAR